MFEKGNAVNGNYLSIAAYKNVLLFSFFLRMRWLLCPKLSLLVSTVSLLLHFTFG